MAYIPLNNEEEMKLANSTLSTQLMIGVPNPQSPIPISSQLYQFNEY